MNGDDVFEQLFGIEEVSTDDIARTLLPFIRFASKEDPLPHLTNAGHKLTVARKVLVCALGKVLLHRKDMLETNTISASEIEEQMDVPGGSVRPAIQQLVTKKVLRNAKDRGSYYIPDSRISEAIALLEDKKDDGQ